MANMTVFKKRLLYMGGGTLLAMVGGAMAKRYVDKTQVAQYSKEIAGVGLATAGSLMITKGDKQWINVGAGVGSTGVALLGNSLYNRVVGKPLTKYLPAGEQQKNQNNGENIYDMPVSQV